MISPSSDRPQSPEQHSLRIAELERELQALRQQAGYAVPQSLAERGAELIAPTADLKKLFESNHAGDTLILTQLHDAVMFCDAEYKVVYVNEAFERLFGWRSSEVIGQPATFRLPPKAHEEVEGYMAQIIFGQPVSLEWEDYRFDGSRIWIHWRAQRVVDAAGRVVGTVNVGSDISERKRADADREQLQQHLYQAQKMETLGTLAGGIAHDFNNILAIIFGFTELALARGAEDPQSQQLHQQVLRAGERGRDLVNRILSFSRFHQPERRPIAMDQVITDAAKFIRATLPSSVEVATTLPTVCPPTLADPHQLHQVLLNLATNAAHAMPHQRGTFRLKLSVCDIQSERRTVTGALAMGKYLTIEAADSGSGMDDSTRQRIFEPFFTTKKEGEGTGLGLSIVSAIMSGHGGSIDVESQPGRGTTFTLYLPLIAGVDLPAISTDEPFTPRLRARGETIAVIDDELAIVSVTEKILQSLGYATLTFSSAEKFHSSFATAPAGIHLVVTDQTMPGMTGLELARRLREDGHQLPILLMTGFSKQLRPELVELLGHAALLRKPFDKGQLARTIRELLDNVVQPSPR